MLEALYNVGASKRIPLCSSLIINHHQQQQPHFYLQSSPTYISGSNFTLVEEEDDWTYSASGNFTQLDDTVPAPLWSVMDSSGTAVEPAAAAVLPSQDSDSVMPAVCVTPEVLAVLEASIQPRGWVVFMMAMFAVIFVFGVIGNILVCVAIARYKFVRSVTAVFIASLAISDINVLLICLPVTVIVDVYHTWYWGTTTCKTIEFFQQLFVFVTILTLAMLAAERYATICYYSYGRGCRNYRKRRKCRDAVGIVIAVWIISALLALPEVFRVTSVPVFDDSPLLASCQSEWPIMSDFALQVFYFVFLFLLPLGVIAFCYYKIVRALSGGRRTDDSTPSLPLPGDPSCPSLMVPSTMFPTRSRSSSAHRKETKQSQLQSDYSEPGYLNGNHLHSHQTSRNTSFSMIPPTTALQSTTNNNNNNNFHTTNGKQQQQQQFGGGGETENDKLTDIPTAQLRQRWRLTKMLITIVILFLVSYLPVTIYLLTQPFDLVTRWVTSIADDSSSSSFAVNGTSTSSGSKTNWRLHWDIKTGIALTVHFLVYVNSTVNPVIYYFMSDKFRQAFRKLLFCGILKGWCERRKEVLDKQSVRNSCCQNNNNNNNHVNNNNNYCQQNNNNNNKDISYRQPMMLTPLLKSGTSKLANAFTTPNNNVIPIIVVGNSNSSGGGGGNNGVIGTPTRQHVVNNNNGFSNNGTSSTIQSPPRLQVFSNGSASYNNNSTNNLMWRQQLQAQE